MLELIHPDDLSELRQLVSRAEAHDPPVLNETFSRRNECCEELPLAATA